MVFLEGEFFLLIQKECIRNQYVCRNHMLPDVAFSSISISSLFFQLWIIDAVGNIDTAILKKHFYIIGQRDKIIIIMLQEFVEFSYNDFVCLLLVQYTLLIRGIVILPTTPSHSIKFLVHWEAHDFHHTPPV